jgi:hypothetical protein
MDVNIVVTKLINERNQQGYTNQNIKDDNMGYFLFQTALVTSIAVIAGSVIGWWLHHFYGKQERQSSDNDLSLVKDYLAESIRESARLKLQLKQTEKKLEVMNQDNTVPNVKGVDFEAYQAFENTVKEAQMRKYLN